MSEETAPAPVPADKPAINVPGGPVVTEPPTTPAPDKPAEPPAPAPAEEPKPDPKADEAEFRKRFAALTRQDREIRRRDEAWKAEKATLAAKVAEQDAILSGFRSGDPIAALSKLGLDFNELAKRVVNGGQASPEHQVAEVKKEIEQLRAERVEAEKKASEARVEQAVVQFKAEIKAAVDASEAFELTRARGAYDDVFDVVDEHFRRTGEVMTVADAATLVEKYYEAEADKFIASKKVRAKLEAEAKAKAQPATPKSESDAAPESHGTKTISNSVASAAAPKRSGPPQNDAERMALAMKIMRGEVRV